MISNSNQQNLLNYPRMTSYEQSIPDLSSTFSIQMSIKVHFQSLGIPAEPFITVKIYERISLHTDFVQITKSYL